MDWLTRSFQEHSVAWLLLASFVGGMIGGAVQFLFEDVLRPRLSWSRETARLVRRYTTPLLRSAESLERRINITVRNEQQRWFENDEYYRLSTLYTFAEYLGWIRILERSFGFVPFESSRRGREFNDKLNGIFRALSSFNYFRDHRQVGVAELDASQVPRLLLSAVGESMTKEGPEPQVLQFTEFVQAYAKDPQFRRWLDCLDQFLRNAHPDHPLEWDRLILAGAALRDFIRFLDPRGEMVKKRPIANDDRVAYPETRTRIAREFPKLLERKGQPAASPVRASGDGPG